MFIVRYSRKAVAVTTALTLTCTGAVVFISERTASANTCTEVMFVGVRGSGEAQGLGDTVQDTYNTFVSKTSRGISSHALVYPASPVPIVNRGVSIPQYINSISQGSSALSNYLKTQHASCPVQKLVIAGYSQGALVVHEGLKNVPADILNSINGIVLYGDPRFDPKFSGNAGTYARNDHGIAYSLLPMYIIGSFLPSEVSGKARSYCVAYDPVCNYSVVSLTNCLWIAKVCAHNRYIPLGYTRQGGEFLASKLL